MGFLNRFFGGRSSKVPPEFQALLDQSMEELRAKTAAHDAAWRLGEASWSVDQDAGTIVFTRKDGITATAPVQIVGTYNTQDDTWLWGWDNPSLNSALQDHARQMQAYGKQHGIERLTTRKLACSEDEAWELVALACKLCDAQGAYRGPAGTAMVFMTFGAVTLSKSEAQRDPQEIDAPEVQAFIEADVRHRSRFRPGRGCAAAGRCRGGYRPQAGRL
jgi:hypothetical protein